MPQFMRSEVVLVLEHMFARHISYKTGIVKLQSNIGGQKVGDILGNCTVEDFKKILENEEDNSLSEPAKQLMKSISTTCQALGHTEDAAKFARGCHYATMDHFGLNSLFLTISPCDECSFRVRLFADPNKDVSVLFHPKCCDAYGLFVDAKVTFTICKTSITNTLALCSYTLLLLNSINCLMYQNVQ
jgi:hypothetical protein